MSPASGRFKNQTDKINQNKMKNKNYYLHERPFFYRKGYESNSTIKQTTLSEFIEIAKQDVATVKGAQHLLFCYDPTGIEPETRDCFLLDYDEKDAFKNGIPFNGDKIIADMQRDSRVLLSGKTWSGSVWGLLVLETKEQPILSDKNKCIKLNYVTCPLDEKMYGWKQGRYLSSISTYNIHEGVDIIPYTSYVRTVSINNSRNEIERYDLRVRETSPFGLQIKKLEHNVTKELNTLADPTFDGRFSYCQQIGFHFYMPYYGYTKNDLNNILSWEYAKKARAMVSDSYNDDINVHYIDVQYGSDYNINGVNWIFEFTQNKCLWILPTNFGKTTAIYALKDYPNKKILFLTTRRILQDTFMDKKRSETLDHDLDPFAIFKNSSEWELYRSFDEITISERSNFCYGLIQNTTIDDIIEFENAGYTIIFDEAHTIFQFEESYDILNACSNPRLITASLTPELQAYCNDKNINVSIFKRKEINRNMNLGFVPYSNGIHKKQILWLMSIIESHKKAGKKILCYVNDKKMIENIFDNILEGDAIKYYTHGKEDKNKGAAMLKDFATNNVTILFTTSKLGVGYDLNNVIDTCITFENEPFAIEQIVARERKNDVNLIVFYKTKNINSNYAWLPEKPRYINPNDFVLDEDIKDYNFYSKKIGSVVRSLYVYSETLFLCNTLNILQGSWNVKQLSNSGHKNKWLKLSLTNDNTQDIDFIGELYVKAFQIYTALINNTELPHDIDYLIGDVKLFVIEKYGEDMLGLSLQGPLGPIDFAEEFKEFCKKIKLASIWMKSKKVLKEKGMFESFSTDIYNLSQEIGIIINEQPATILISLKDKYKFTEGAWKLKRDAKGKGISDESKIKKEYQESCKNYCDKYGFTIDNVRLFIANNPCTLYRKEKAKSLLQTIKK